MDQEETKRFSKKMSYALRHRPESLGLTIDKQGWADVEDLLRGMESCNLALSLDQLEEVVGTNNKKRFEFNSDKTRIRARQGHSIKVDLGYKATHPPRVLYHGTPARNIQGIMNNGLSKKGRHHVHLSPDTETAREVALRRGPDWVILEIQAQAMEASGAKFYMTDNQVWLTEHVPPEHLGIHSRADQGQE